MLPKFRPDQTYTEKMEAVAEEVGDTQDVGRMKFFVSSNNEDWERVPNVSIDREPEEDETVRVFSEDYLYVLTADDWGDLNAIYFARRPEVL